MCFRIVCYSLLFVAPPLTCCSVSVSPSTPLGISVPQTPRRSKAKRKLCLHTTFTWLLWMFLLQLCLYRRDLIKFACAYVPVCGLPAHSSVLVALSLSPGFASCFLCSFSVPNLPSEVWTTCFVSLPPRSVIITGRSITWAVTSGRISLLIMFRAFGTSPAEASPSTTDFYHPWGISFFSSKGEF